MKVVYCLCMQINGLNVSCEYALVSLCMQINGLNVSCASHEYAVQLIRETSSQLVLHVLTVNTSTQQQPTTDNNSHTTDGKAALKVYIVFMTTPNHPAAGLVAQWLGRCIRDRKVHGSMPSRCTTK